MTAKHACYCYHLHLFTNTKAGEDSSQQVIGTEFSGDFTQHLLRLAQVFGQQFTGAVLCQLVFATLGQGYY